MDERTSAYLRIAIGLAIGLIPGVVLLVATPSRGSAVSLAGSALMAVGFVVWLSRLVGDGHDLQLKEAALRMELAALEEKAEAQERELRDVRTRDAVTGTLNRSGFLRKLNETIVRDGRLGRAVGFLIVDIEGFKAINAERGRIGGDATLLRVAHALEAATRGTDCVGRLGGDEFGVVLNECDDPGPVVNRIFQSLNAAGEGEGASVVHVSVGAVTIEDPARGVELQELFRVAEGALASVRGTGGSLCARRTVQPAASKQVSSA